MINTQSNQLRWLWLSILTILVDQASKFLIVHTFTLAKPTSVFLFLTIVLTYNTGAAFGFLSGASGWQNSLFILIAVAISIFILYWLYRMPRSDNWIACGLALILGGALGNLYDRFILGYVIDFIDLHIGNLHFPAYFNLADVAINIGVLLWIIGTLKKTDK